jgi:hypothetical protein
MREVQLESVLQFKEMNKILYFIETSAKTGKNVDTLFSDCAKFIYLKYKDRMHQVGHDGDLSSDNEGIQRRVGERSNSFLESNGHRVTRLNGRNRKRNMKKERRRRGCKC